MLCVQYRVVPVEYFMDTMQDWEIYDVRDALDSADRTSWEQTRWLGYLIAQINCKKTLEITDLLKFPWDDAAVSSHNVEISNDDIERLKKNAEQIGKLINS